MHARDGVDAKGERIMKLKTATAIALYGAIFGLILGLVQWAVSEFKLVDYEARWFYSYVWIIRDTITGLSLIVFLNALRGKQS